MDLVGFYEANARLEAADFRFVALKEFLKKRFQGRSVCDIGCGAGTMVRELTRDHYEVLGIEPEPRIFSLAKKLSEEAPVPSRFVNLGIEQIDRETARSFENFLLIDVLEHLSDDRSVLKSLYSVMPESARILCVLPALERLYGERDRSVGHYRRYSARAVRQLFESCPFRNVQIQYWNLIGTPVYWFFEKVLGRPVNEDFRKDPGLITRFLNASLLFWFRMVENRFRFPLGMSLIIQATK